MKIITCIPKYNNYEVEAKETDTIYELKTNLLKILNIHTDSATVEKILIIYKKTICNDQQTLSSLNIADNTRVFANFPKCLRSKINTASADTDKSNSKHSTVDSNLESTTDKNNDSKQVDYSSTHQLDRDNTSLASSAFNNLNFSFPEIKTNQKIYTYSQEQTQNAISTGDSSSNPIVVPFKKPFPSSINEFYNYAQSDYENNVSLLVSLGYKERAVRNMLSLAGNNLAFAQMALKSGVLQNEETNKLAESLAVTSSQEKRDEIIRILLKDVIEAICKDLPQEDKEYRLNMAIKQLPLLRQHCNQQTAQQYPSYQNYQMIQQSKLSQSEQDILPLLRNAMSGKGGFSDNPFATYLQNHDETTFIDLNGNPSEKLFDQFLSACTLDTEQWKFIARCMLSGIRLSDGLFYLESADNDPVLAASLMKE